MRRRETVVQMTVGIVATEKFHGRTRDGVAHQIQSEDLAVEFATMAEDPREAEVKREVEERVIKLRGMNGSATGEMIARETDGPWKFARAPVAAAVHETAEATEHRAECNRRCHDVGDFPERNFFKARKNNGRQRRADEAAVENETAALNHKNFPPRFAGEFIFPVADDEQNSRADDSADE